MRLLKLLTKTSHSALPILIRVMVGVVFVLEGIQKFLYPDDLGIGRFTKIGLPAPEVLAPLVGATEVTAGTLVLFGFLTRGAASALATIMIVAILSTKVPILLGEEFLGFSLRKQDRYGFLSMAHEMRTDWSMLLGSIYLIIAGAGRWSIDNLINSRRDLPAHQKTTPHT